MDSVQLLKEALEHHSPSGSESAVATFLVSAMDSLGLKAHIDAAGNAVGETGSGRTILLVGHMDTVPGVIPAKQQGDILYGRGAVDAKGALTAFIIAASKASGNNHIVVVGAVEEENASSKGARHLIGKYNPEFIIIGEPSGTNGITLGYKGRLLLNYELQAPMAHTACSQLSPADEAVNFYSNLKSLVDELNKGKEGKLQVSLGEFHTENSDFAQKATMDIRFRTPQWFSRNAVEKFIHDNKGLAAASIVLEDAPFTAEKNTALVRAFTSAIRRHKLEPVFKFKSGTSDMNILGPAFNVPIVAYGPGDSSLDHTPDERISITEYHKSIEILAEVLTTL